jgi:hypothetical protein
LGFGDWGLGIGDWGLGPIPNPHQNYKNENNKKFYLNFKILKLNQK